MTSLRGVYAITDDQLLPDERLPAAISDALRAGARLVQRRSKARTPEANLHAAAAVNSLCQAAGVPLVINDDIDLCLEIGAAGVHLGRTDECISIARSRLPENSIVGATCHDSLAAAREAQEAGASYVAFGRFYPSRTKPQASPAPVELLSEASSCLDIPLVAIGGINCENGAPLIQAGADMLAAIHGVFGETNRIFENTAALVQLFEGPGQS